MAAHSRKFLPLCAALLAVSLATACDPNVVIGAKHDLVAGGVTGGSEDTAGVGGTVIVAGSGGVAGDGVGAGSGTGGDGGSLVAAGAAGAPSAEAGAAGMAGNSSGLVFAADHETGNLKQWDDGPDDDSGGYYADDAPPVYSTAQEHSGNGSAKVTINTTAGERISRLYRRVENSAAYYSAWFYLAEDHVPETWWSIFLFRAVEMRQDSIDLWSVDLVRAADKSKLTLAVYDHQFGVDGRTIDVPSQPIVPVGAWFQLEAYLQVQPNGGASKLTLWLNGQEFLSIDPATPAPTGQPLYWVVGNGAGKLTPAESTVYVDDAQISTSFVSL